jgi:hypothetical protein
VRRRWRPSLRRRIHPTGEPLHALSRTARQGTSTRWGYLRRPNVTRSMSSRTRSFDRGDGCANQSRTASAGTPRASAHATASASIGQAHKRRCSLDVPGATRSLEMRPGQAPNRAGRSPRRVKRVYLRPIQVTRRPSSPPWLSACDSRQPTPTLRSRKAAIGSGTLAPTGAVSSRACRPSTPPAECTTIHAGQPAGSGTGCSGRIRSGEMR